MTQVSKSWGMRYEVPALDDVVTVTVACPVDSAPGVWSDLLTVTVTCGGESVPDVCDGAAPVVSATVAVSTSVVAEAGDAAARLGPQYSS